VVNLPANIPPNTAVTVGVVRLVLNEQIPFSAPDDGLTVNVMASVLGLTGRSSART
jgi:hypothetical protein